jgi:hypothetical protein
MLVSRWFHTAKLAFQQTRNFTDIPVINVAALVDTAASATAKEQVGQHLHRACCDVGFFYIHNHGALNLHLNLGQLWH